MSHARNQHVTCQVCGKQFAPRDVMPAGMVRSTIVELIVKDHPKWSPDGYICLDDLDRYRSEYVEDVLEKQRGELTDLEEEVIRSLQAHELVARDVNATFDRRLTFGERVSDNVADFGGSWTFIFLFFGAMLVWIVINSAWLLSNPFDPYPYILLNLVLSCLAAIQAPIIMMSQNRQEDKDRLRGEYDYRVNLKAELEIRHLNSKMDLLLTHEWQRLLEIQQVQTDLMKEIAEARRRK